MPWGAPGLAPDVTAQTEDSALARRVLGNGHEHVHEMPTLTLPSPFQGEGLQPLVRVHVAVNVPVPVRAVRSPLPVYWPISLITQPPGPFTSVKVCWNAAFRPSSTSCRETRTVACDPAIWIGPRERFT